MIDYELKAKVIELGLDELERQVSKSIYYHIYPNENYIPEMSYELAVHYENYYMTKHKELWLEARKINNAMYDKVRHLKNYIKTMLSYGDCIFLTFTFTDKILNNTTALTRRNYVQRYLRRYNTLYVANKDFGKKNGREHYHAVILVDRVDNKLWKCGAIDFERVKSTNDFTKLAKYVAKLTNHAIKETTKRNCMLYSRMTFVEYEKIQKVNKILNSNFEEIEYSVLPFVEDSVQYCLFD